MIPSSIRHFEKQRFKIITNISVKTGGQLQDDNDEHDDPLPSHDQTLSENETDMHQLESDK